MFESDMEKLKAKMPGKKEAAAEHALNIKYLKDRTSWHRLMKPTGMIKLLFIFPTSSLGVISGSSA